MALLFQILKYMVHAILLDDCFAARAAEIHMHFAIECTRMAVEANEPRPVIEVLFIPHFAFARTTVDSMLPASSIARRGLYVLTEFVAVHLLELVITGLRGNEHEIVGVVKILNLHYLVVQVAACASYLGDGYMHR
jgi:hypothetical protein